LLKKGGEKERERTTALWEGVGGERDSVTSMQKDGKKGKGGLFVSFFFRLSRKGFAILMGPRRRKKKKEGGKDIE